MLESISFKDLKQMRIFLFSFLITLYSKFVFRITMSDQYFLSVYSYRIQMIKLSEAIE